MVWRGRWASCSASAPGSLQFLANGAWTKRFQVGWAAMNGLAAATMVREGFKGAAEALEGNMGFLRAYAPYPIPERAVQDLGTVFELMQTAVKPYPCCRYGHAGIDAALALRAEQQLKPAEIEHVTSGLSKCRHAAGRRTGGEEGEPAERGGRAVQRAVRHFLRAGDRRDGLGQLSAAERSGGPRAAAEGALRARSGDRGGVPAPTCRARSRIEARGQTFVQKVVVPKGEPANFLTEAELRAKFAGLADAVLGADRAARLADAVLAIDATADVAA